MSVAVAWPRLIRKLQCSAETCAPPMVSPRQPAASINCQAFWPGGFLKVEPQVLFGGWLALRFLAMSSIAAVMVATSPDQPWNSAWVKTMSSGIDEWRYV